MHVYWFGRVEKTWKIVRILVGLCDDYYSEYYNWITTASIDKRVPSTIDVLKVNLTRAQHVISQIF